MHACFVVPVSCLLHDLRVTQFPELFLRQETVSAFSRVSCVPFGLDYNIWRPFRQSQKTFSPLRMKMVLLLKEAAFQPSFPPENKSLPVFFRTSVTSRLFTRKTSRKGNEHRTKTLLLVKLESAEREWTGASLLSSRTSLWCLTRKSLKIFHAKHKTVAAWYIYFSWISLSHEMGTLDRNNCCLQGVLSWMVCCWIIFLEA